MSFPKFNNTTLIALLLFLFTESALLFYTPRTETAQLIIVYLSMFVAYMVLYHEVKNIRTAAFLGVLFRSIAWLAFPALSNDIYRFIWDGSLVLEGVNPYLFTPTQYLVTNSSHPFDQLYPLLNSPDFYSVYPVVIQVISAFGALATNDYYLSALIIKLPILVAEIATIWMLPKVLMGFKISPKYAMLYMLNPLLIIDVVGNAHFEALAICFILLSIKWLQNERPLSAGAGMALAVATKLLPLILVPFILKALSSGARKQFFIGLLGVSVLTALPLLDTVFIRHFISGIGHYFQSFEFNASIYYIVSRSISWFAGYDAIAVVGPALGVLTIIICWIIYFRLKPQNLKEALAAGAMAWTVYLFLSTTVYPWYVAPLLVLGMFGRMKYPIIWSAAVFLSYSFYSETLQWPWFVATEYFLVAVSLFYPKFTKRLFSSTLR